MVKWEMVKRQTGKKGKLKTVRCENATGKDGNRNYGWDNNSCCPYFANTVLTLELRRLITTDNYTSTTGDKR